MWIWGRIELCRIGHETEMYCIIHYSVDTYTDKGWGCGDEDPDLVNPAHFDAMQIVGAAKAGDNGVTVAEAGVKVRQRHAF